MAEDTFDKRVFAVAGVCSLCLAAVLVAVEFATEWATPPRGLLASGPSNTAGIMILCGPLIAAWAFSVHVRCSDAVICRNLKIVAALLAFWILAVLVKYPVQDDHLASLLWYSYYLPMAFIPTLFLASALRASTLGARAGVRKALPALYALDALFVALVFTNNMHHQVFLFSFDDPFWSRNYIYQWGYWLFLGWSLIQYSSFFAVSFIAARKQLRSSFVPLLIVVGLGLAYSLQYVLRETGIFSSNFSLVYALLVLVALELSLDLGILPSYMWYGEAFRKLPFDLQIVDGEGRAVYRTDCAKPLAASVGEKLACLAVPEHGWASFRSTSAPETLFKAYRVSGGIALLAEDLSALEERRRALSQQQSILERRNEMLVRERDVSLRLLRQRREAELYSDIDKALSSKVWQIKTLLAQLPEGSTPEGEARRRELLMEVKMLVAYCKRKGGLVLAEKSDPEFNRERLQLVFNETAADLRSLNIDCAALVEISHSLSAPAVSLLYDCLYDFAAAAFAAEEPVLMLFVGERGGRVEMRAALQAEAVQRGFGEALAELDRLLSGHGIDYSLDVCSAEANLVVRMDAGGR